MTCPGLRSPADQKRPSGCCRNCRHRIAHIRGERGQQIVPYAVVKLGARLRCTAKEI